MNRMSSRQPHFLAIDEMAGEDKGGVSSNDITTAKFVALLSDQIVSLDIVLQERVKVLQDARRQHDELMHEHQSCLAIAQGKRPQSRDMPYREFAVGMGVGYHLPEESYSDGMKIIAALVKKSTDDSAAVQRLTNRVRVLEEEKDELVQEKKNLIHERISLRDQLNKWHGKYLSLLKKRRRK